jgi:hypothetical protein
MVGVGLMHRSVERLAWAVPGPSRRFFVVLGVALPLTAVLSSGVAAIAAARGVAASSEARDRDMQVAKHITEFRDHISLANGEFGTPLVSGRSPTPLENARYEAELLSAGQSLTDAGAAATGEDAGKIADLAPGLRWCRPPYGDHFHSRERRGDRAPAGGA